MTSEEKALQQQIDQLEIKISFQEHSIETLNEALIAQQKMIETLNVQVHFLSGKLKAIEPANIASMSEETPPPHY